jgi:hypothetical protein
MTHDIGDPVRFIDGMGVERSGVVVDRLDGHVLVETETGQYIVSPDQIITD